MDFQMISKTKVSNGFQTAVPAAIRKSFGVSPGDLLEWEASPGAITVRVRKRRTWEDIRGIVSSPAGCVEAKRRAQRGRRVAERGGGEPSDFVGSPRLPGTRGLRSRPG